MDTNKTIDLNNLKQDKSLTFLYKNIFGRIILKVITLPFVSAIVGKYMSSSLSKGRIEKFITQNNINMDEYEKADYKSFNEFFTRKIKAEKRPFPTDRSLFFSPCDGKLSAYKIKDNTVLPVKGSYYTINHLLCNSRLAKKYREGYCLVFRLAVDDYHRYAFVDDGIQEKSVKIKGILHTVQPIALNKYPVFVQNSREYAMLHTENFGDIVQVEVGALMVGKIKNHISSGKIERCKEKGMFLFGGSTIILLCDKDAVEIDKTFFTNTENNKETIVKMGQVIGKKI